MIEIPGFTIDKEIGHGGMATVYLGVQDLLKRNVALKVMLPEMVRDKNFRNSFMSEGAIIASLDHPNIVRIHDIGIIDETILYMAMEYLSGNTLKEKLNKGKLSFPDSFRILKQVASGLVYAHDKGYIHRDVKPGNILFRADGTAVLTDFGIAKLQDTSGELTRMGYTMGTVQYMSPEQVVTTDLDKRSDIYSLGLIFYEMLTGRKAFKADTTIQAIHQHTTLPPPTMEGEYAYLQAVIDKVLAKEPENRYQNADDFVKAVSESDPQDKTVIHRIPELADDDFDKTTISKPYAVDISAIDQQQTNIEKKKGKLIPISLAAAALIGITVFGVIKFTDFGDGNSSNTTATFIQARDEQTKPVEKVSEQAVRIQDTDIKDPKKEVVDITSASDSGKQTFNLASKNNLLKKSYEPKKYHDAIEKELDKLSEYSKNILDVAPENKKAQRVLNNVLDRYYSLALNLVKSMEVDKAATLVNKALKVSSKHESLIELKVLLERKNEKLNDVQLKTILGLNDQAKKHIQAGRYLLPKGKNALEVYQKVLTIDPHNENTIKEINSLLFVFEKQININLNEDAYQANELLNQALVISPFNEKLIQLQNKIKLNQSSKS
ncbi:serine/threonine-protein kinase [uncultured Cocleimonas sp.]|uniref:serine/threonine protein kinase n=1 Tax=uncultured Cocleimonas sp. TaxID=1051587 RepID=UPI00261868A2|nr:serine/threonine-protein kinase [uncultured Cocleimonas sp.]